MRWVRYVKTVESSYWPWTASWKVPPRSSTERPLLHRVVIVRQGSRLPRDSGAHQGASSFMKTAFVMLAVGKRRPWQNIAPRPDTPRSSPGHDRAEEERSLVPFPLQRLESLLSSTVKSGGKLVAGRYGAPELSNGSHNSSTAAPEVGS